MDRQDRPDMHVLRDEAALSLRQSQAELAEVQRRIEQERERLQLLDRLLELEGQAGEPSVSEVGSPSDFIDACVVVLREEGKPMHITDIHSSLLAGAVPIPGKGTQANVISRIHRSDGRIIRTGRGFYGLPDFGHPEVKPSRRKRVSQRRLKAR